MDEVFKALGDPTRLRIVGMLAEQGEVCVCRIVEAFGMHQPAVSHHMAKLKQAGLVHHRKQGQWVYYSLNIDGLRTGPLAFLSEVVSRVAVVSEDTKEMTDMTEKSGCCCGGSSVTGGKDVKAFVKEKYGQVAVNAAALKESSCGCGCTSKDAITRDLYSEAETSGIPVEALLASMGCANPMALANLSPGEVVLDLGSGGGIDVLLSAKRVGPTGKAYGLDMTDEMLALARKNQAEAGIENVEFLKGEIEEVPLPDSSVDVIISNCVINLSTDKDRVLREAFRVLKPGGRFAVADIVLTKQVPQVVQEHLAMWAGCVSGALEVNEYKCKLLAAGFTNADVEIVKTYSVDDADGLIPDEVARQLGKDGMAELMSSFVSAFVRAEKAGKGCCCCG